MGCRHAGKSVALQLVTNTFGLTAEMLIGGINHVYEILDTIDDKLLESDGVRLVDLVELANFSAIVGNLFRRGIVKASNGCFAANAAHTYPDLLGCGVGYSDTEIKVALEQNRPKGHRVQPGPHIAVRYVLGNPNGHYERGKNKRGKVAWIWEIRLGFLEYGHFNFSNTEGDSGKTAVVNSEGMKALIPVYCDLDKCPFSPSGPIFKKIRNWNGAPEVHAVGTPAGGVGFNARLELGGRQ
jgi:hypothetical protein